MAEKSVLLKESDILAFQRTILAQERTLMAWVRTSLSMISFGFTIYKFFGDLKKPICFLKTLQGVWMGCSCTYGFLKSCDSYMFPLLIIAKKG